MLTKVSMNDNNVNGDYYLMKVTMKTMKMKRNDDDDDDNDNDNDADVDDDSVRLKNIIPIWYQEQNRTIHLNAYSCIVAHRCFVHCNEAKAIIITH